MSSGSAWHARVIAWRVVAVLSLVALAVGGCIIKDGEECDRNQVYRDTSQVDYCDCAPGTVEDPKGFGCLPCGANEDVVAGKCECRSGYSRPPSGGACAPTVGQVLGAACTGAGTCSAPYPYCATDGNEQYCTLEGCGSTKACGDGYRCSGTGSSAYCEKVSGLTTTCASSADCAAFDANSCDTVQTKKCVVALCASDPKKCAGGTVCCDLSGFMPGFSTCISGTSCPIGTLVAP